MSPPLMRAPGALHGVAALGHLGIKSPLAHSECCACWWMDCCPARLLPPWASAHMGQCPQPPARRVQPHGLPVSHETRERAQALTPAKSSAVSWPHAPGTVCFMRSAPAVFAAVPLPLARRTGLGLFKQLPAAALQ